MLTTSGRNSALAALPPMFASAHFDYPGEGGSNEITGGSYSRQTLTLAPVSNGKRVIATSPTLQIPAGQTVAFIGVWTTQAAATGVFLGYVSPGYTDKLIQLSLDGVTLRSIGHDFVNGQRAVLMSGTIVVVGYVISVNGDTFRLSATPGGSALDLSGYGIDQKWRAVQNVLHTYGLPGLFNVPQFTVDLGGPPPNRPPVWSPSLTLITGSVNQSYDLRGLSGASDPDNDTLTFSVDPTGAPLNPLVATLSPNGILTFVGAGDITGVRFIADDGK